MIVIEYLTIKDVSEKWGLGSRIVSLYCAQGKIPGVIKKGNMWLIPKDIAKPIDGRRKKAALAERATDDKNPFPPAQSETLNHLGLLDQEMLLQILKSFPYPIQIYRPDGVLCMINDACLKVMHIPSEEYAVGKFNVLRDGLMDAWGKDVVPQIRRSFEGEIVEFRDLKMPIQGIINRFGSEELCVDSIFQNIVCYPIFDAQHNLAYVIHVFVTSKLYDGKEEIVKAKEYIESHWLEEYDIEALSSVVRLSQYHFTRLFKRYTGMTPYAYYQEVKLRKIKEKLCDKNLSVTQAFASCGVDYNGSFSKLFKAKVGMTPTQYRNTML